MVLVDITEENTVIDLTSDCEEESYELQKNSVGDRIIGARTSTTNKDETANIHDHAKLELERTSSDVVVIKSTSGTVLPHSREDCLQHPWKQIAAHSQFCGNCYCFVCEIPSSQCGAWDLHCKATRKVPKWVQMQKEARQKGGM